MGVQQATEPSGGWATIRRGFGAVVSGAEVGKAGVTQRSMMGGATDFMPLLRTASMRTFHVCADPIRAAVLHKISFCKRSGAFMPIHIPVISPSERPQK